MSEAMNDTVVSKLLLEGFLAGQRAAPQISNEGWHLLNDFWPEEFSYTEQRRFVQEDDIPF